MVVQRGALQVFEYSQQVGMGDNRYQLVIQRSIGNLSLDARLAGQAQRGEGREIGRVRIGWGGHAILISQAQQSRGVLGFRAHNPVEELINFGISGVL